MTKPRCGSTGPPKWTGAIGRGAVIDLELVEHVVQPEPRDHRADADADRALLVMPAHRDDRLLEARIADARHRQQELSDQKARRLHMLD